jgi:SHS2 domain-containing protein
MVEVAPRIHRGGASRSPVWVTAIEHTADVGIAVRAPDRSTLFARAAWGMFSLIGDLADVRRVQWLPVRVEADDREALLVRWLSELNFLHQTRRELYSGFRVRRMADTWLEGEAGGEPLDETRHHDLAEIKAVTYCGLRVAREGRRWMARVIFDV